MRAVYRILICGRLKGAAQRIISAAGRLRATEECSISSLAAIGRKRVALIFDAIAGAAKIAETGQ
jgi:hypothetical protein